MSPIMVKTITITFLITIFCSMPLQAATAVDLHVITRPELPTVSQTVMLQRLSRLPAYNVTVITHNYRARDFPELEVLPAFFFSADLARETKIFRVLTRNRMVTENWTVLQKRMYEVPASTYDASLYPRNQRQPGALELFYRPFCPYGIQALKGLLALKQRQDSPLRKLVLTPIVQRLSENSETLALDQRYRMSGGLPEMEETIRQLVIYETRPDKLLVYLEQRKQIQSSYWTRAARKAGLDGDAIVRMAEKRSIPLLENAALRSRQFHINASPTYLWENQRQYNYTRELLAEPAFKNLAIQSGKSQCR